MGILTKLALGLLTMVCAAGLSAQEIIKIEKAADLQQAKKVTVAGNVMLLNGGGTYESAKTFALDPAKKYQISGEFAMKSGKPVILYLGFCPLDSYGRGITSRSVNSNNNSLTTLVAAAKKGDKVIKVKDASKWNTKSPYSNIVFGAKKDLSDLPNFSAVATARPNAKLNKGVWEITLKAPLAKAIPAGTSVRQHYDGSTYIYTVSFGKLSNKWVAKKGIISGIAKSGLHGNKMWAGTKKVRLLMLLVHGDGKSQVQAKNVKVVEVK